MALKSLLQREWYPLLMGLKHDLAIGDNTLPLIRLQKTQLAPLSMRLDDMPADEKPSILKDPLTKEIDMSRYHIAGRAGAGSLIVEFLLREVGV